VAFVGMQRPISRRGPLLEVNRQKAAFLFEVEPIDVCSTGPCTVAPS